MKPIAIPEKTGLILISGFYILFGAVHFFIPGFYLKYMPLWIEPKLFWVYLSGLLEIGLGILLFLPQTRKLSAWGIIIMLFIYLFLIHIPITIQFYKTNPTGFIISMVRNPFQLLLIYWAYLYTK